MGSETNSARKDSVHIILDPPTFSPPPEMRKCYLDKRMEELDSMLDHARMDEWKPVVEIVSHVRGTGAMYGFKNIGDAAENVMRAVQNGEDGSLSCLEEYVITVRGSYV